MDNKIHRQKGLGVVGFLLYLVMLGFLVIYSLQIGLGYLNKNAIEKAVTSTLLEFKSEENPTKAKIKASILKKIEMNNIDIHPDSISVFKEENGFNAQVKYTKTVGINEELSLTMDFLIDEYTP